MPFASWLRNLARAAGRTQRNSHPAAPRSRRSHQPQATFRPQVEQLTDRIVPTASFLMTGNLLTVTCNAANDNVTFTLINNGLNQNVFMNGQPTGATVGLFGNLGLLKVNGSSGPNRINAAVIPVPCTLNGGAGEDTLIGGSVADVLNGGIDNDTLTGNGGNDSLFGGDGDDKVEQAGAEFILTNSSLAAPFSNLGTDSLSKVERAELTGDDNIFGNTLNASTFTLGRVTLIGAGGNDVLLGGSQNDLLSGGTGNDTITGGTGADQLFGGDGDDQLYGTSQAVTKDGASDIMNGNIGDDFGSGQDTGDVFNEEDGGGGLVVRGTDGDDIIVISRRVGTNGPEAVLNINGVESSVVYLNGETIRVFAGKGNDIVVMDESTAVTWSAQLYGEQGHDLLVGASRGDYLDGGEGRDTLLGQAGADTLIGGAGSDEVHGGAGVDIIQAVGSGNDWIHLDLYDLVAMDKKDLLIWV